MFLLLLSGLTNILLLILHSEIIQMFLPLPLLIVNIQALSSSKATTLELFLLFWSSLVKLVFVSLTSSTKFMILCMRDPCINWLIHPFIQLSFFVNNKVFQVASPSPFIMYQSQMLFGIINWFQVVAQLVVILVCLCKSEHLQREK